MRDIQNKLVLYWSNSNKISDLIKELPTFCDIYEKQVKEGLLPNIGTYYLSPYIYDINDFFQNNNNICFKIKTPYTKDSELLLKDLFLVITSSNILILEPVVKNSKNICIMNFHGDLFAVEKIKEKKGNEKIFEGYYTFQIIWNNNINVKMKELEKKIKEREIVEKRNIELEQKEREEKQKKLDEQRKKYEKSIQDKKIFLLKKMRKRERKREEYRNIQKEQILENFNQLYIKRTDRKLRVVRYEKIQDYKRQKTKEEIEERMRKAEKIRLQKELIRFERLRINEEVRQKKNKMIARFKRILHDDNHYTKEEIVDFVIKGEKLPKQFKKRLQK